MAAIELKNVSYAYQMPEQQPVVALRHINLSIKEGEFVVVLGHNGSGKSTLAKLLNGLLVPSDGVATVFGVDTKDEEKIFDVRRNVGMVFQNPDNQMIASIVEDDIAFGPENLGIERNEIRKRVDWALKAVGMYEHKNGTPFKMSGGQKQRIAIAAVLAMKPRVLVLDESTAMLDPVGRREIMQVIGKLNREEGIAIVHITHYMEEALSADRVIVIGDGEIIADGTPREIFENKEAIKQAKLTLPIIADISSQLINEGLDVGGIALDNESLVEGICRLL